MIEINGFMNCGLEIEPRSVMKEGAHYKWLNAYMCHALHSKT